MLMLLLASPTLAASELSCPGLEAELAAIDLHPRCLTVGLNALAEAAVTPEQTRCASAALAARGLPTLPVSQPVLPTVTSPPDGHKVGRDAFGVPNVLESENFALRWGGSFSESTAQGVLDYFEDSWQRELVEMDYPAPVGSDDYLFNVYVGDSGEGAPSAGNAAGYYYVDSEGWPMIVLSEDTANNMRRNGRTTVAHEFFHAIQGAAGTYAYRGLGAWYYEATASWIEVEVFPDDPYYVVFLFGYSFMPHLPINAFDYPDTGAFTEYHQYGAFIFIRYLAEHVGGWELIRESWLNTGNREDPLAVLDQLLDEQYDTNLVELFPDFVVRNVTWDYAHGDLYQQAHEDYERYYPQYSYRETATHRVDSNGWQQVNSDLLPQRFGSNYIRIRDLDLQEGQDLRVGFSHDAHGNDGSPARWAVHVVVPGDEPVVVELESSDLAGEGRLIEGLGPADEVWLALSNTSYRLQDGETFGYSYLIEPEELPEDSGEDTGDGSGGPEAKGCGCSGAPEAGAVWTLPLLGLLLARRRRR